MSEPHNSMAVKARIWRGVGQDRRVDHLMLEGGDIITWLSVQLGKVGSVGGAQKEEGMEKKKE